jgi:hypothetical protein
VWTWFGSPFPLPGRDFVSEGTVTTGGGAAGTVVTGGLGADGVGAGGLATGVVVVVGGCGAAGGVVGGVVGGMGGGVTAGPPGFAGGGFGLGRLVGCGVGGFGSEGVVAVGRMATVGRTTAIVGATLCG